MEYINGQNLTEIVSHIVSKTWLFFLLGLIYLLVLEHKVIFQFFRTREKNFKILHPLARKSLYLGLGLVLIYGSWTITNYLSGILIPSALSAPNLVVTQGTGFWAFLKYQSGFSGLISTALMIFAGISLLLSAGGRWLVNLAKLFATVSILYLTLTAFVMFA